LITKLTQSCETYNKIVSHPKFDTSQAKLHTNDISIWSFE